MKTIASQARLVAFALCSACSTLDLGGLDKGPGAQRDALSDAPRVEAAGDAADATDGTIVADGSVDGDARAAANDSSDAFPRDVLDTASDAAESATNDASDAGDAPVGDAAEGGQSPVCSGDLSRIGTADFRVSFTMRTQTTRYAALINQRSACGRGSFWDVRVDGSTTGGIYGEIDDGTHFISIATAIAVNDGTAHDVVFTRAAGTLAVSVDGAVVGTIAGTTASTASFGGLVALREGTDPCDGVDGTQPLIGMITNVCISH